MEKCVIALAIAGAGLAALGEPRIVSSEVKLNESLSRAEAVVRVSGCTPGERVRIRLCVDRDARSTPVDGDGLYKLATPLRDIAGFKAQEERYRPSVTLVRDDLRRYDEGEDPLDRARLHFLAPNGPARPMELSKGFVFPVQNNPVFTGKPEWVMPVGAGELSAMVSFGTNEWHVNLSKTDYYLDKKGAGKDCDICSPGHVQLVFDGLKMSDIRDFDQAMDVKRGRVTLSLKTDSGTVEAEIFGDRKTGALVGIVNDLRRDRTAPPRLTYESNHPNRPGSEMTSPAVGRRRLVETFEHEGRSFATEVARFNDGMFVIVSKSGSSRESAIAAVESAIAELKAQTVQELAAARDAWWKDYWSKSFINVTGDARAALIERLWYAQLYVWAGVGFGRVPPKFNGGAGLVLGDGRSWGAGVWTQNTRELCWPLGAANHREFMRRFVDFYESCRPQIEAMHAKLLPAVGGFRMFETIRVSDSGFVCAYTNAASLDVRRPYVPTTAEAAAAWKAARHSKKKRGGNGAAICSSGTEILQQMVDYVRYYGDTSFVPVVAAWLRSQTELYLALLEKGEDGRWHPVNTLENESWYCPEDCHVDLCAARFCLGMTAKLGRELGFPAELVAAASERLGGLAPLPTAQTFEMDHANISSRVTKVTPGDRLYLPFKDPEIGQQKGNLENNELYAVYPFTMGDREKSVATFRQGSDMIIYGWEPVGAGWGWYPVPMWASRLCLPDAADFVYAFAVGNNTWPFGGGRSPAAIMYKGAEVEDSPYLDSAGVLQAATQELFLQSHAEEPDAHLLTGGPIRLIPAVPKAWSGSFKLLARGGFEIECAFEKGVVTKCTARSTRGGAFRYVDPWTGKDATRETKAGETVVLTAQAASEVNVVPEK